MRLTYFGISSFFGGSVLKKQKIKVLQAAAAGRFAETWK